MLKKENFFEKVLSFSETKMVKSNQSFNSKELFDDSSITYLKSKKRNLDQMVNAMNNGEYNNPKIKHDCLLFFTKSILLKNFDSEEKTIYHEPEYFSNLGGSLLPSPDMIVYFPNYDFSVSFEVKTHICEKTLNKAKTQIENSFKYEKNCKFGFLVTNKSKELLLNPVISEEVFHSLIDSIPKGKFRQVSEEPYVFLNNKINLKFF